MLHRHESGREEQGVKKTARDRRPPLRRRDGETARISWEGGVCAAAVEKPPPPSERRSRGTERERGAKVKTSGRFPASGKAAKKKKGSGGETAAWGAGGGAFE